MGSGQQYYEGRADDYSKALTEIPVARMQPQKLTPKHLLPFHVLSHGPKRILKCKKIMRSI